jgi:hypothetical protein
VAANTVRIVCAARDRTVSVTPGYGPIVNRRFLLVAVLSGIALVALLAWPIAAWANHQPGPWPEALQASATILLIVVTAIYVVFSGRSVSLARESLDVQLQRIEAAQHPYVIPVPTRQWIDLMAVSEDWANVIPVKNVGPGVAINVRAHLGNLGEPSGVYIDSVPTSLGSGDSECLILNWASDAARTLQWDKAKGVIDYEDFAAARWRSEFAFYREGTRLQVQVYPPVLMMRSDGGVPTQ